LKRKRFPTLSNEVGKLSTRTATTKVKENIKKKKYPE
jgi:hypothetical protein